MSDTIETVLATLDAGEQARLDRLEALLRDIDAGSSYPVDWLVFRVTGVAPDASSQTDVAEGGRLIEELVTLVEDVDRKLGPRPRKCPWQAKARHRRHANTSTTCRRSTASNGRRTRTTTPLESSNSKGSNTTL